MSTRKLLSLASVFLALALPAHADMYPDASNAVLPVARTNLGLGTMATQNANAVAITGGTIGGLTSLAVTGAVTVGADQASGIFGTYDLLAGNNQSHNSIIGEVLNNSPPSTVSYPAGVTGYGAVSLTSSGNTAFGIFGYGVLQSTGGGIAIAAEVTASNVSTHNPDTNLPPNSSFGTTTSVTTGENVTCHDGTGTKDCSIGIYIANETQVASDSIFNTGEYIRFYRQYGLYIDAMPSGAQTGAVIKSNGNGINLILSQVDGGTGLLISGSSKAVRMVPGAGAFSIEGVDQTGSASYQPLILNGSTLTLQTAGTAVVTLSTGVATVTGTLHVSALPTSAGGGGLNVCVDTLGQFYKKATCP